MLRSDFALRVSAAGLMTLASAGALAQDYPGKPIRFIAGAVGGGNVFWPPLVPPPLSAALGQPIIIENRPNGPIGPDNVARAAPDGYTLLINSSFLWVGPLFQRTQYDPA